MKNRAGRLSAAFFAAAAAVVLASFPAMAGDWKKGTGENADSWWYDLGSGKWAKGWEWIDGDNDGVAEKYYFDQNGWLLTGTVTPDGFTVNAEGAWVDGGNVRIMVSTVPGEETPAGNGEAAGGQEAAAGSAPETAAAAETDTAAGGPGAVSAGAGEEAAAAESNYSAALVERARSYVGKLRYVYGGYSLETGTDCSGFTKLLFAEFGIDLPRGTGDQLGAGTRIPADQVRPGDLVFWANGSGRIYHVGIISGNGMFIHASNTARGWVFEDRLGDMPAPAGYARY